MWVEVVETHAAAPDGIHTSIFEAGKVYDLPGKLAETFIREGWGRESGPAPLPKAQPPLLLYCVSSAVGSSYKYVTLMQQHFGGITVRGSQSDFAAAIDHYNPDMVVVFGDWRQDYVVALRKGVPYILIENDVHSWRTGDEQPHEQVALESAAAVLFTSEEHRDWCARYDLPMSEVVHLRPLREQLAFAPLPKLRGRHLVYAGGLFPLRLKDGLYGYRCYHDIFAEFIADGWKVHLYPAKDLDPDTVDEYEALGCIFHDHVPHCDLPRELSQYTAGLQGYGDHGKASARDYAMGCRPNKLWDYLAAGIPTIGVNTGRGASVYEGRWGIVPQSLKGVKPPKVSPADRFSEVMEADLPAFKRLLGSALVAKQHAVRPRGETR